MQRIEPSFIAACQPVWPSVATAKIPEHCFRTLGKNLSDPPLANNNTHPLSSPQIHPASYSPPTTPLHPATPPPRPTPPSCTPPAPPLHPASPPPHPSILHPPSPTPLTQADQKKAKFFQPEGDHLTLLAVYEAWKASKFSTPWCKENYIQDRSLKRAQVCG